LSETENGIRPLLLYCKPTCYSLGNRVGIADHCSADLAVRWKYE